MVTSNKEFAAIYEDPQLLHESILYTARTTGFNSALIEKDFFCSLVLDHLYSDKNDNLIFKGGTCLSKIHSDFYRLSEDLDFIIPVSSNASKSDRSKLAKPLKIKIENLSKVYHIFELPDGVVGHNSSKQYIALVQYISFITAQKETIKVEIGLREDLLMDSLNKDANTLLINPFSGKKAVHAIPVSCMSFKEAYSEKVRAALTRREPAIRDFYDIDYAVRNSDLDFNDGHFLDLVAKKLAVPGNDPIDLSTARKNALKSQIDTQLKPVLRSADFRLFDLDRAFEAVVKLSDKLQSV